MTVPPLYERFRAQVAATPDAIAVDGPAGTWSYRELDRRAGLAARLLDAADGRASRVVGLLMDRSPGLVAAMLGVIRLGCTYLPLDPRHPAARLRSIVASAGCPVVLADPAYEHLVPGGLEVRVAGETPGPGDIGVPAGQASADDLAAVFHTSGSAGRPKSVAVTHGNILSLLDGLAFLGLGCGDRVAHAANPAFDAATFEIWAPLTRGATVVVMPRQAVPDVGGLLRLAAEYGVSAMFLTTSLFRAAAAHSPAAFAGLRYVLFGGETADSGSVVTVLQSDKPDHLLNVYGPTETTTFATAFEIPPDWSAHAASVPIGAPLAGVRACLFGPGMSPVPAGAEGELYIGGASVSRGYLGAPGLTAERFVPDPSPDRPGQRLYRTGDIARMTADGELEFTGRADGQVKIRGNRVELAEVEGALRAQPGISAAAAAVWQPRPGDQRLVACVVCPAATDLGAARGALRDVLPDFMVPALLVRRDSMPYNSSGKVDRDAVREAAREASLETAPPREPAGGYLGLVLSTWEEILRCPVADDENFFDAGGDSILLLEVHALLVQRLGREVALMDLLEYPTASGLAARLEATLRGSG